jgi:hypothetical protein
VAPFFMMFFGYYYMGNRQMFFSEVEILENKYDVRNSNHKIFDFSKGLD